MCEFGGSAAQAQSRSAEQGAARPRQCGGHRSSGEEGVLPGVTESAEFEQHHRPAAFAQIDGRALNGFGLSSLVRASLNDGHEHVIEFDTFTLGILVRADQGHGTYAAVHITGSVPPNLTAVVLRNMPGCDPDGWFLEMALPTRTLLPGEQVWSTVMDPTAAAELLNHEG
ncbi:hypothetical protein OHA25_15110 [Nonomuraea sp. NBC_00507]|uniref:hypothetical protein n=1 Tax=Nonomuraea sp. NBC_00507 TaxID=2976002 RepID=UPI002E1984F5